MSMSTQDPFRAWYAAFEAQAAKTAETFVAGNSFAELMGLFASNAAALTRIGTEVCEQMVRNAGLAGRADLVRLGQQLARIEDKLERVLTEVEDLRDGVVRPIRPVKKGKEPAA
jgi:phytoene/squalene synthetase